MNTPALIDRARAGWLFGAAGAALVAAQATLPALPDDTTTQVARVAAHRGAVLVSGAAFLIAGALLIAAVAALNAAPLDRARKLTGAGLLLTGAGAIWPLAGRATFNLVMVALTDTGTNHATAVAAAHAIGHSGAFNLLLITLAAFALGPIVLGIGLWRAGLATPWPALLWLTGVVVVNAAEASSRPIATLGMTAAAAALTWLGATVAGTPAEPRTHRPTAVPA